eukprot:1732402-Pyramimonas_sp.AAC.1
MAHERKFGCGQLMVVDVHDLDVLVVSQIADGEDRDATIDHRVQGEGREHLGVRRRELCFGEPRDQEGNAASPRG